MRFSVRAAPWLNKMKQTIEIESIEDRLDQARRNLRQTVAEVNRKVEHQVEEVAADLSPRHMIQHHFPIAAGLACVAGFTLGAAEQRAMVVATLLLGGVIGAAFDATQDGGLADES